MQPTLVFSHGNGFVANTYTQLFEVWRAAGWRVEAIERFGHDPRFEVRSNWRGLRDQLIEFVAAQSTPCYLVGHSLGGLLSLLATCARPDLVAGLVMLDSPVITGWRAHSLRLFKHSRLIHRVSPGWVAQRRRQAWPSREAVYEHFKAKPAFARWDDRVLRDYVQYGFEAQGPQMVLRFDRDVETRIYNTLPHHLGSLIAQRPPQCPVAFLAGRASQEMRQGGIQGAQSLARERFEWVEGTHLYPMEQPVDTAQRVLRLLEGMR